MRYQVYELEKGVVIRGGDVFWCLVNKGEESLHVCQSSIGRFHGSGATPTNSRVFRPIFNVGVMDDWYRSTRKLSDFLEIVGVITPIQE